MFEVQASEGAPLIVADPDDDVFLYCAVAAGAACVISGDQHLQTLGEHACIPILTIREFLSQEFPDLVAD